MGDKFRERQRQRQRQRERQRRRHKFMNDDYVLGFPPHPVKNFVS